MDHLSPELPVVALAVFPAEPPCLVGAHVDHLAAAVAADRNDRLPGLAVHAGIGRVDGEHGRLRVRPGHRLVPGQRPEVCPCLPVLGVIASQLHEVDEPGIGRELQFERPLLNRSLAAVEHHRQHVGQRRADELAGPEPVARDHHEAAAKRLHELLGHFAEPGIDRRGRHVAEEDHVVGEELAAGRRGGRQEELVIFPHLRIGRPQERAEAAHAHERIAVEHLLDEPPLPAGFILHVHQPQEIVADVHLAGIAVVVENRLAFERRDLDDELMAAHLLGRHGKLGNHRRPGACDCLLPDRDRAAAGLGGALERPRRHRHVGRRTFEPRLSERHDHGGAFRLLQEWRRLQVDGDVDGGTRADADGIDRHAKFLCGLGGGRPRVLIKIAHHHHALKAA